jgi:hypothetical protein
MPTETEDTISIKSASQMEHKLLYYACISITVTYGERIPPDFFLNLLIKPNYFS